MKRLYRSRKKVMLGGVCGGLAEYLDIDPVIVRLGVVLLLFAGGAGLLIYILAWIIIPKAPEPSPTTEAVSTPTSSSTPSGAETGNKTDSARLLAGLILIILGFIFLFSKFLPWFSFGKLWPLILIVLGILLLLKSS